MKVLFQALTQLSPKQSVRHRIGQSLRGGKGNAAGNACDENALALYVCAHGWNALLGYL